MPDDGIDVLLRYAGVSGPVAGPGELDRVAARVVGDGLRDELVSAVLETCDAVWDDAASDAAVHVGSEELGMRIGGWRLDLGRAAVRGSLMTAVLAAALVEQGLTEMLIGVVAAVVPSVLDVERVALSAGDRWLVLELRLHPDVATGALSEDALYERLPPPTREVVNRLEFADFVQRLREAGYAGSDGADVAVRDPDGPPVRFSWR